jgi:hypothetical protein
MWFSSAQFFTDILPLLRAYLQLLPPQRPPGQPPGLAGGSFWSRLALHGPALVPPTGRLGRWSTSRSAPCSAQGAPGASCSESPPCTISAQNMQQVRRFTRFQEFVCLVLVRKPASVMDADRTKIKCCDFSMCLQLPCCSKFKIATKVSSRE